jgi:hypothetical protein
MNRAVTLLALAGLLCLGGTAMAELGTLDNVPAATLLIPRFEVDLAAEGGITTLFSVNNASAASVLAHVTLWTEWWIPILDFDIYLTGYDVQSVNVRDLLNGVLPRTGTSFPTFPPVGAFSGAHINFPGCSATPWGRPNYAPLPASQVTLLKQAFSGQPITALGGACASEPANTGLARGYITIDSVNNCSQEFPGDPGYFAFGGTRNGEQRQRPLGRLLLRRAGSELRSGLHLGAHRG